MRKIPCLSLIHICQKLFENLDFEIKRGEHVALIGNNGTGKTTILKILNGMVKEDAGVIRLGSNVYIGYYDQEHQVQMCIRDSQ